MEVQVHCPACTEEQERLAIRFPEQFTTDWEPVPCRSRLCVPAAKAYREPEPIAQARRARRHPLCYTLRRPRREEAGMRGRVATPGESGSLGRSTRFCRR